MKYELVNIHTKEVVTTVDVGDFELPEARFYFQRIKRLSEPNFNDMYEVRKKEHPIWNAGKIEWWKEEQSILDDESKLKL